MKKYLALDVSQLAASKDLSPFMSESSVKLHLGAVVGGALAEIERYGQEQQDDEEFQNEDLVDAQETAGFHEVPLRHAIGALFNHLFFWNTVNTETAI
jgi:superoxide dismutase